jgi:hypothetical protein
MLLDSLCKSSVPIVDVYRKNVNLASLLANVEIAVVNWKNKDVVVRPVILSAYPSNLSG